MLSVTTEPLESVAPAPGCCETTTLRGFVENTPRVVPRTPRLSSFWSAAGAAIPVPLGWVFLAGVGAPVRAGAVVSVALFELFLSSRVERYATARPASTRPRRTSSHGQRSRSGGGALPGSGGGPGGAS